MTFICVEYIIQNEIIYRGTEKEEIITVPDDHLWALLILSAVFLFFGAMLALMLCALTEGSEVKLKKSAEDGDKQAKRLLGVMTSEGYEKNVRDARYTIYLMVSLGYGSFAAAILLVINKAGLLPGEHSIVKYAVAFILSVAYIFIYFLFSSLLPNHTGSRNPAAAYAASAWIARPLCTLFHPVATAASFFSVGILRLLRVYSNGTLGVTEDEILEMIDIGEESGGIESAEREMIQNVFEFSDTTADDVMTHRTDIEAICLEDTDDEIFTVISESGFSRFPAYEESIDEITGIIYTREYLLNRISPNPRPIRELLHEPLFVPEQVRAGVLFKQMQESNNHMAIVIDEYGGTSGLVTMEDLLEEIFGNIYDEFDDKDTQQIQKIGDNLWRVAGPVDLETLSEELNFEFDDEVYEEYDTLGGLVFSCLSVIPDDGERPHVEVFGLDIQVEVLADKRVEWATVSIIPPEKTKENETNANASKASL